jgi:hypothetical protein
MPGSSTTPGRLGARVHAPIRVAFRIRNGVGTRDNNLCEAQWLACVLLYRRFAAALTGDCARLEADVVSYSFIVSDLHRLLVAGLPAHCERFWTLPARAPLRRRPALAQIHCRLPIAPISGPAPQFACVGFCPGLPELRARASMRFGSSAPCRRKFSARGPVSHYAG